jgi:hypothetical protein
VFLPFRASSDYLTAIPSLILYANLIVKGFPNGAFYHWCWSVRDQLAIEDSFAFSSPSRFGKFKWRYLLGQRPVTSQSWRRIQMSRVKFLLAAVMGLVVTISSANVMAQECCDSGYARGGRVGLFARMRATRYTNNCCPAPAQNCCPAPVQTCCATPAPVQTCCATPAPCCGHQTACCESSCCNGCGHASNGCCRTGMVRSFRARGCHNCGYASTANCCGTGMSSGCSGCAGCAGGQIIQGSSEGVIVPEASGQPTAPETPAPSTNAPSDT